MRKLLALFLVITMFFSIMLTTACNQNKADNKEDESSYSSIEEESSSERHRGDGASSNTGDNSQSNIGGGSSSDDIPINSSSDNPNTSSSDKPQTSSGYNYGNYDYSYSTSVVMPTDMSSSAGILDSLLYVFVEDFPKPVLTDGFYATLADYEQQYNTLSATEKASVQNYPILLEARNAYNNMAKQECEKLINDLPDATIDNVEEFSAQANAIAKLIANLGNEANSIPNKAIYDEKTSKIDGLYIDSFNKKVSAIATFEYTTEYKAKLDDAMATYNNLSASQKSAVKASYDQLNALITRYGDTGVINEFNAIYSKLPTASAVTKEDKTNIELARTMFNNMTATQLQLLGDVTTISANLKNLKDAILVLCPEFVFIRSFESNKGNRTKTFANSTIKFDFSGGSTGSASTNFVYDGKPLKESFNYSKGASVHITGVPYGGKLVVYVTNYDKSQPSVTVSGGSYNETIQVVEGQPTEFNIPVGGDYTITFTDRAKLYGMVFS